MVPHGIGIPLLYAHSFECMPHSGCCGAPSTHVL